MANASILAAFSRMWEHVLAALNTKSDIGHTHDDRYYSSLSQAIADINNQEYVNIVDSSSAKVKVFPGNNGRTTVMLLDDVSESTEIVIGKDIDLVVNGKTLSFTTVESKLTIAEGVDCVIDGSIDGSKLEKAISVEHGDGVRSHLIMTSGNLKVMGCTLNSSHDTSTGRVFIIQADTHPEKLILEDCTLHLINSNMLINSQRFVRTVQTQAKESIFINCNIYTEARECASIYSASDIIIDKCTIKTKDNGLEGKSMAVAVYTHSNTKKCIIKDSTIISDAKGSTNANDLLPYCYGIYHRSTCNLVLENCYVNATHSGVAIHGNLQINGGTYTGYQSGGVYVATQTANMEVFINDATLRCGNYEGEYDFSGNTLRDAALSVGSASNITVYIDNCIIDSTDNGDYSLYVRDGSGETNNVVNMSNCTILDNKQIHIGTTEGLKVNIGVGNNVITDMIDNPDHAEFTNELYRRNYEDKVLDGNDFDALRMQLDNKSDFSGDYNDLENAPNITENESGEVIYMDNDENIIARIDTDGFKTTAVITDSLVVNGVDVGDKLNRTLTAEDFTVSDGVLTFNFL